MGIGGSSSLRMIIRSISLWAAITIVLSNDVDSLMLEMRWGYEPIVSVRPRVLPGFRGRTVFDAIFSGTAATDRKAFFA